MPRRVGLGVGQPDQLVADDSSAMRSVALELVEGAAVATASTTR